MKMRRRAEDGVGRGKTARWDDGRIKVAEFEKPRSEPALTLVRTQFVVLSTSLEQYIEDILASLLNLRIPCFMSWFVAQMS